LLFIDETSSYLNHSRAYGRAEGQTRVYDAAPKGKKERSSLIAAISAQGLVPEHCLVHKDSVDKAAFLSFLKELLPRLDPGSILVMDNWTVHHGEDIRLLVEQYDCQLRYLPTYSPDFNPIEHIFAKVKAFIKAKRPMETVKLIQAFVDALFTVTTDDVQNAFRHCGYQV
jgi:hypothetical protein